MRNKILCWLLLGVTCLCLFACGPIFPSTIHVRPSSIVLPANSTGSIGVSFQVLTGHASVELTCKSSDVTVVSIPPSVSTIGGSASIDAYIHIAALQAGTAILTFSHRGERDATCTVTVVERWPTHTDAGQRNWTSIASSASGNFLFATASGSTIFTSTNAGATWLSQNQSGNRDWRAVACSADGTKLVAAVNNGSIYTSIDGGQNWSESVQAGVRTWSAVASSSDGAHIAAFATDGLLSLSSDSGTTWVSQSPASAPYKASVSVSGDGNTVVSTAKTGINISHDFGQTWALVNPKTSNEWVEVALSGDGSSLVASDYDDTYLSTDRGVNWILGRDSRNAALSSDGGRIVGWNGSYTPSFIFSSPDTGKTWTKLVGSAERLWRAIACSSDGLRIAAVVYGGYIYTHTLTDLEVAGGF